MVCAILAEAATVLPNISPSPTSLFVLLTELLVFGLTSALMLGVGLLAAILTWTKSRLFFGIRKRNTPRYPVRPLPVLGHFLWLWRNPRQQLLTWRETCGDIFCLKFFRRRTVILNGYDVIKEVLSEAGDLKTPKPCIAMSILTDGRGKGIINANGFTWKEQRSVATDILNAFDKGPNPTVSKIEDEVAMYIKQLASFKGKPMDIRTVTSTSVSNIMTFLVLSQRFEHGIPLIQQMIKIVSTVSQIGIKNTFNSIMLLRHLPRDIYVTKRLVADLKNITRTILAPLIYQRQKKLNLDQRPTDFIDAYLQEMKRRQNSGVPTSLSVENLFVTIKDIFSAGCEPVTSTVIWCFFHLLHHPLEQENVYQEIVTIVGTERRPTIDDKPKLNYLNAVVMETQRLASVTPLGFPRQIKREIEVQGLSIPAGSVVVPNLDSVLWDSELWGDPHAFRPSRFLDANGNLQVPPYFMPYSVGSRACLGETLANVELFLTISAVLQRFHIVSPDREPSARTQDRQGFLCGPREFKLRLLERNNGPCCNNDD